MKILLITFIFFSSLLGAEKSLIGIGVGVIAYPDYIGSNSYNKLIVPLPYIRFTNAYFKIDEDGVNARLFDVKGLSIGMSFNGSLPVNSEDNVLREGMQDLDFIVEIGPKIVYTFYTDNLSSLKFQLPLRAALSTDFSYLGYQGITSHPHLKYTYKKSKIEFILSSGFIFSDKKYNSYFYDVEDRYITQTRAGYKSHSGFGGFKNKISLTYKQKHWLGAVFMTYHNISGATFEDASLIETQSASYIGTSLIYFL